MKADTNCAIYPIKAGCVIRFTPRAKKNAIVVQVDWVNIHDDLNRGYIYGHRCAPTGELHDRARFTVWPVDLGAKIEVLVDPK
jgi:hypothetical protein